MSLHAALEWRVHFSVLPFVTMKLRETLHIIRGWHGSCSGCGKIVEAEKLSDQI